jgi:hypothetical protein
MICTTDSGTKQHSYCLQIKVIIIGIVVLSVLLISISLSSILSENSAYAKSPTNFIQLNDTMLILQNESSNQSNPCGIDRYDLSCNRLCNPWEPDCES